MNTIKTLPQYTLINGIAVAIIYRRTPVGQTEPCPFCTCSHSHSAGDGMRSTDCPTKYWNKKPIAPVDEITTGDGKVLRRADGYYLKTQSDLQNSIFDQ